MEDMANLHTSSIRRLIGPTPRVALALRKRSQLLSRLISALVRIRLQSSTRQPRILFRNATCISIQLPKKLGKEQARVHDTLGLPFGEYEIGFL